LSIAVYAGNRNAEQGRAENACGQDHIAHLKPVEVVNPEDNVIAKGKPQEALLEIYSNVLNAATAEGIRNAWLNGDIAQSIIGTPGTTAYCILVEVGSDVVNAWFDTGETVWEREGGGVVKGPEIQAGEVPINPAAGIDHVRAGNRAARYENDRNHRSHDAGTECHRSGPESPNAGHDPWATRSGDQRVHGLVG
jgi:hypothetical protein